MRFTSEGIGWLIAGGIICATAIGSDGFASAVGMVMIGLVFVAVYFIKQYFDPAGLGWFIAGGLLLAFCVETMIGVAGGLFRESFLNRDDLSDTLVTLIIALGCMFAFYKRNKRAVDDLADDIASDISMHADHKVHVIVAKEEPAEAANTSEIEFELDNREEPDDTATDDPAHYPYN